MYAAISIPHFWLQAAVLVSPATSGPKAILEADAEGGKARILEVDKAARTAGVVPGMTATQGLARCKELALIERSVEGEEVLHRRLLHCAEEFAPDFEATADGVVTIDLVGNPRLDATAFGRQLSSTLGGTEAYGGLAGTPDAALVAAKIAAAEGVAALAIPGTRPEASRLLSPLPVAVLDPAPGLAEILRLWGVRTCGDLARLPEAEAGERLGPDGAALRSLAAGQGRRRLLRLVREPTVFAQSADIEGGAETLEPVLFLVRRLLETLVARLETAYLVAGELRLWLGFEDGGWHARVLRVPEPCADVGLLFRMVDTHLEGVTASAPVVALRLEATPARKNRHQHSLFESSLRDPNRFAETLARLEAMAGPGRVGMPEPARSHRPDAFFMGAFQERITAGAAANAVPARIGPTLRRFRPPVPASVECASGSTVPQTIRCAQIAGRIRLARGPWLVSGNWWEPGSRWQREEWDVEMADQKGSFRLAREGRTWHLEGRYG